MNKLKSLGSIIEKLKYMLTPKQRRGAVIVLIVLIIGSFLEMLGVTIIVPFIESILTPDELRESLYAKPVLWIFGDIDDQKMILILGISIIIIYIVKNLYMYLAVIYQSTYRSYIQKNLSVKLLKSYMSWPYEDFSSLNTAKITQGIDTDIVGVYNLLDNLFRFISEFFTALLIGIFIIYTDWFISLSIILVAGLCFCIITLGLKKKVGNFGERRRVEFTKRMNVAYQAIGGFKEIRVSNTMDRFIDDYAEAFEGQRKVEVGNEYVANLPERLIEALCISTMLGVICVKLCLGQDLTAFIPKLAMFAFAAFRLLPSVSRMTRYMNGVLFNKPYMENAYKYLKEIEDYENKYADMIRKKKDECELRFEKTLVIDNVEFGYAKGDRKILTGATLQIDKGDAIGLIGPSGAGKTTLADVVLGLLYPGENKIMLDGHDVYKSPASWSKLVGYVPQNVFLADSSIRDNVAFGEDKTTVKDEDVWKALEEAQLADYVRTLPEGLDTQVGERGIKFSGGQRQRVAIARVMYKNPEIIVFDEATSALDNDTEKAVMESIDSLSGTKTLIIVAHRLTTIKNCNKIYEINEGKATLKNKEVLDIK